MLFIKKIHLIKNCYPLKCFYYKTNKSLTTNGISIKCREKTQALYASLGAKLSIPTCTNFSPILSELSFTHRPDSPQVSQNKTGQTQLSTLTSHHPLALLTSYHVPHPSEQHTGPRHPNWVSTQAWFPPQSSHRTFLEFIPFSLSLLPLLLLRPSLSLP